MPTWTSYDEVPYESLPFAQSHPSRLATVATVFGLQPPPVEHCRVLELGCAAGGNLLPMAEAFPASEFVGVDLSARQIAEGQRDLERLGLTNVRLHHANILDIDNSYGSFDYIICHGVFSWVPRNVQEHILALCGQQLTPRGVAYISYNTYPGWHMRGLIRDIMRYHALRFPTPQERVGQARALIDFLAQSVRNDTGAYAVLLRTELELMQNQSDHYLYHEQLEDINDPMYFHTFIERAQQHRLRYLGEARVSTMVTRNFGPDVQKTLSLLASDLIQTEQYLDFVRNRTFRETLLVRDEQTPDWTITPERMVGLHIASPAQPQPTQSVDLTNESPAQFVTPSGLSISATWPLLKATMQLLAEAWPGTVPYRELLAQAAARCGRPLADEEASRLTLNLLNAYLSSDVIELHATPITLSRTRSEKPRALAYARLRAAAGHRKVTNRRHEVVILPDLHVRLVPLLDGRHDREALLEALTAYAQKGDLTVNVSGQPVTDAETLRRALARVLEPALETLARDALLVG
ncbi:MAG: class I SAM-dependent methyltransferase [Gemmata sp.]|nr:class I SAM-dependent methyltransferase [Gemmata sp.]